MFLVMMLWLGHSFLAMIALFVASTIFTYVRELITDYRLAFSPGEKKATPVKITEVVHVRWVTNIKHKTMATVSMYFVNQDQV